MKTLQTLIEGVAVGAVGLLFISLVIITIEIIKRRKREKS